MTPEKAVQAAHAAICEENFADCLEWRGKCVKAVEAAAPYLFAEVTALVAALTDPEDCHFDHHGGCQAHGYLDLKIGEMCPQLEAKAWAFNHGRGQE